MCLQRFGECEGFRTPAAWGNVRDGRRGRIARGDLESKYRQVELLFQALESYFTLRGLWYRGPKAGLPWLARYDPETHAAFARALEPRASFEDLQALIQRVLPAQ